ncbi:LLM class flavin-dependent oxidoreductase, partial [Kitasatospora phosalacinea]|uniref:LLM class flavin-dependent oxidoreductase n=1 Tax=Kitasatospora phosalacinea TaxID=2065 RepID=UPI003657350A
YGPHPGLVGDADPAGAEPGSGAALHGSGGRPLGVLPGARPAARAAGRTDAPRIQVAFRPIIAPTEELAWEKAHRTVAAIKSRREANDLVRRRPTGGDGPENAGSQRLVEIAEAGERYDRALWTPTAAATGGAGNSNALVGTPETVAQALLDYYDLGVDILSARGYDHVDDAIDFGRYVIPIVREEVAKRDAAEVAKRDAAEAAKRDAAEAAGRDAAGSAAAAAA